MARVLVTGMSGAGKTTVLDELQCRGHLTVDTDYDGWELPDGTWDEPRMTRLLAAHHDVIVSGTVSNQGCSTSVSRTSSCSAHRWASCWIESADALEALVSAPF